jgi:hypothetical protein
LQVTGLADAPESDALIGSEVLFQNEKVGVSFGLKFESKA